MIERRSCSLAEFTTFGIGGIADSLWIPEAEEELVDLIGTFRKRGQPYLLLGNGSNLLVASSRIRKPVILIREKLAGFKISSDGQVEASAGTDIRAMINACANQGFRSPLELLTIPATLGGAIFMNAGRTSFGVSISDGLESVRVFDGERTRVLAPRECAFGHRTSVFHQKKNLTILGATFRYQRAPSGKLANIREQTLKAGANKCYRTNKSAGSVFKKFDRRILSRLKGVRLGAAMYAPNTGNCILNMGGAKAYQILLLIKAAQVLHWMKLKRCVLEIEVW